ncbi:hypothetical protein UFOVP665_68 [uncultured Caudovirales phage]|jgi:IS30 family transposase|uniref:Uncharacterized protein n=1 Tax=uncultured Caudovirales phage TaxID=2100421 RepID=A0A6J5NG29_9CAUD|nr:hypothetical protein UFOVP665_68 [uncultured Caudovirales phage]
MTDTITTESMNEKLEKARHLTDEMRRLEQEIMNRNNERRNLIRSAWKDDKLPQRQIANALGLTNQTVWNEIHRKDNDESATK